MVLMSSDLPRATAYLQPDQHQALKARAEAIGITLSDYLRRLVERDLAGEDAYVMRQLGHQMMFVAVVTGALAKDRFTAGEYDQLRKVASQVGLAMFGPLPPRPFDVEAPPGATDQILALHEIIQGV